MQPSSGASHSGNSLNRQQIEMLENEVSLDTYLSVARQWYQEKVKKRHHQHRDKVAKYIEQWKKGEPIVSLAERDDVPACTLARLLIPVIEGVSKQGVKERMRNVHAIRDQRLRQEVIVAQDLDMDCSPSSDFLRNTAGSEYE